MNRLAPQIASLAATRLFAWHREQAKIEVGPLRQTIRRLSVAGVPNDVLARILESDQWQLELAKCMIDHLET